MLLRWALSEERNDALRSSHILTLGRVPESDAEFLELLELVARLAGKPVHPLGINGTTLPSY